MKKRTTFPICFLIVASTAISCTSIKPYQKMWINDTDMRLSPTPSEKLNNNFQTYREGASGGNGGKSGGGCGCN